MRRLRKYLTWILVLLLVAMAVAATVGVVMKPEKIEYKTDTITRGSIKQFVSANGTLNPTVIANVGTQVSGQVTKLYVDLSDQVKKGQLIAEIDPSLPETQLKQSKSRLEIARINFEQTARDLKRSRELFKKHYIARVEVEQATQRFMSEKLSYESAKADVEQSEINLSYTKITSPIDGIIISREVTEGQTVAASFQTPNLFKIAASLEDMKIDVNIPESDIGGLKVGMPVTFTVDAYPDREFVGQLQAINTNPKADQLVVTYSVLVTLKNEGGLLLPGMTAYVNITQAERVDVLRAPAAAFRFQPPKPEENMFKGLFNPTKTRYRSWQSEQFNDSEPTVYVMRDGVPKEVKVTTGMIDEYFVEISSDEVKEGDVVVIGLIEQEE